MVPKPQVQVQEAGEREGDGRTESTQPGKNSYSNASEGFSLFGNFLTQDNAIILFLFRRGEMIFF